MAEPQSPWAGADPAALYVVFIAVLCAGWLPFATRKPFDPRLNPANIAEPIEFDGGDTSDFDGTLSIALTDAYSVAWRVDLIEGRAQAIIRCGDIDGDLPMVGPEEKALTGILTRWAAADPEAHRIDEAGTIGREPSGKAAGVAILRQLRLRNE